MLSYDAAGNLTNDTGQPFTYDATGAQVQAPANGVWQGHDGDGLRVKNVEGGTTYYLHSTVLGGQVVAELDGSGNWTRGYVYAGEQMVAIQKGAVYWTHQDPINKSQRLTDAAGNVVAGIELDPWGGETNRSWNTFHQPHRYTSWERGWTGDESLFRRYHGWFSRFAHPDPYDGSYDSSDPQSFNRYAYVQNDPVNFVDPSGLDLCYIDIDGKQVCIPAITAGVTVNIPGSPISSMNHSLFDGMFEFAVNAGVELENPGGGVGFDPSQGRDPKKDSDRASRERLLACLRAAFKAARQADQQNAQNNAITIRPDATSVVSAGFGFVAGGLLTGNRLGALAGAAVMSVVKDVVAANVVRGARRAYHSVNIGEDLHQKVNRCNEQNGGHGSVDSVRDAVILYGNELFK